MEIITNKYGDAILTTKIHGNRLELATPENIKTKIIAGSSAKDGRLYVFKRKVPPLTKLGADYLNKERDIRRRDDYFNTGPVPKDEVMAAFENMSNTYKCSVTDYVSKDDRVDSSKIGFNSLLRRYKRKKRTYLRHKLYWFWQSLLNKLFSVNGKGMLLNH